ncbi:hypothetical protein BXZ70DRAFT_909481 [Cristinia sonorae]|uniref:Uncharacterized protein n=1 Tax=Cristinia sonorae TaxID=1940300 RepID=A0A8K0UHQ4_9AGAR|nr:hypothetical protein BXZ70DRAFT_909481 [Cristinia sonorae]
MYTLERAWWRTTSSVVCIHEKFDKRVGPRSEGEARLASVLSRRPCKELVKGGARCKGFLPVIGKDRPTDCTNPSSPCKYTRNSKYRIGGTSRKWHCLRKREIVDGILTLARIWSCEVARNVRIGVSKSDLGDALFEVAWPDRKSPRTIAEDDIYGLHDAHEDGIFYGQVKMDMSTVVNRLTQIITNSSAFWKKNNLNGGNRRK